MVAMTTKHKFTIFAFSLILISLCSANSAQGVLNQAPTITPTGLVATAVSPTQINLSWTAPTQNYGKTIVGYKIEQDVGHGIFDTLVYNSGSVLTTYSITDLKTDVTYTYRVSTVYSDDTSSGPSNPASGTPTTSSTMPPSNVSPSTIKNMQFDFVPSDGTTMSGVIVSSDDYLALQYKKDARSVLLNTISSSYPINNNISYLLTYQNNHLAPDSIPAPLIANAVSDTKILLTWLPPLEQYGQQLEGYKIELKNAPGDYQSVDDNTGSGDTKYYVTGLESGKTYTFRVFAVYPGTHSNPSNEASATTLVSPSQPVQKPGQAITNSSLPSNTSPSTTSPPIITTQVNNVQFDFTAPDTSLLSGVILSQSDYQQFVIIKDPRAILSNVTQTSATINNNLSGLLRYQNIHTIQQTANPPIISSNSSTRTTETSSPANINVLYGVVTSVLASGVVGIITWLVKTKVAKKIAKEYHFTLEKFSSTGVLQVRIRNSGETIEDCIIMCEKDTCAWADTNMDKSRHIYEGSVSSVKISGEFENKNPLIIVKSGKKILRKIKLDDMAHGQAKNE